MSDIVHVNPQGRRLFTAPVGGRRVLFQAATAQEVQDWIVTQFGADSAPEVTDAGHADRTEVTGWGFTDRL